VAPDDGRLRWLVDALPPPGSREVTGMAAPSPVVFLLDVDNTLIDNDRVART